MAAAQLDLFAGSGNRLGTGRRAAHSRSEASHRVRATEAGRRRLVGAVVALEALCRRFRGFGAEHPVPEQTAALETLAEIGGTEAARAVKRIALSEAVPTRPRP